jgi:hypothetical protein
VLVLLPGELAKAGPVARWNLRADLTHGGG